MKNIVFHCQLTKDLNIKRDIKTSCCNYTKQKLQCPAGKFKKTMTTTDITFHGENTQQFYEAFTGTGIQTFLVENNMHQPIYSHRGRIISCTLLDRLDLGNNSLPV